MDTAKLSLLPLAMRMGGPREAVWHAIIRKNYGCTHLIVGRDHAGPGADSKGKPFYGPYDAQALLKKHENELGVTMVPFQMMVFVEEHDTYYPEDEVPQGMRVLNISGTELRQRLAEGRDIPEWFTFPDVVQELRRTHPPRKDQGFTLFFTGLSGAGKSTIANVLLVKLLERGGRPVTILDGDIVRKHLSSELGFSKEHRDINIRRIGYVASEITKNGGIAICAPIAPYDSVRKEVRAMIEPVGGFILIHLETPLDVCEGRDRKGMYAKARQGIIKEFTGISDPYEVPQDAEMNIDTSELSPEESAQEIVLHLEKLGYIGAVISFQRQDAKRTTGTQREFTEIAFASLRSLCDSAFSLSPVAIQRFVDCGRHRFGARAELQEASDSPGLAKRIADDVGIRDIERLELVRVLQQVPHAPEMVLPELEHALVRRLVRLVSPFEHLLLGGEHLGERPLHEDHLVIVGLRKILQEERDDLHRLSPGVAKPAPILVLLVQVLDALVLEIAFRVVLPGGADTVGHDGDPGGGQHLHRHGSPRTRETGDHDHRLAVTEPPIELLHRRA